MSGAYGGVQAVAYREGQRRRFAPGGTLGRAAKKEKERKRKKRKREKENMEEACNYSKTKMEHLSCGALTHNLACWRPCPFWLKRVVRRYVLLRKALKCIGS